MGLAELCVRRPVLATVLNLLVMLAGVMAFELLTVREYPNIDMPVVTVQTDYRGASAAIVESTVTKTLEDSLSGIEGIDFMTSTSRAESSQISLTFDPSRDIDSAANDVRDRVARVRQRLPEDVDEPRIAKAEADAQPILWLALSSSQHSPLQISQVADVQIKDRLQSIPGIADIRINGERRPAMRVWLDAPRLAALGLTPADVETALRGQNVEIPSGRIESDLREFSVLAETDLNTPAQFAGIVLRDDNGMLVRLGDVARIEVGPADIRRSVFFNGTEGVGIGVIRLSTANPLEVSRGVRAALPGIIEQLPPGMTLTPAYDSSVFIDASIDSVVKTLLEAVVLVVLVIFLFLRSVRATLIPLVTIPVSLIGALVFMQLFGFSLNTLTLLAFVLAIGLVVDDAIVVLENIYRHIEEGLKPFDAAIRGIREIAFAVMAMTFTLVAVFAPLAFSTGRTGKLFTEFALTLAAAVLVSGFCALTLSPMMCARVLKPVQGEPPRWSRAIERGLNGLGTGYRRLLLGLLPWRLAVALGAGVLLLLAAFVFRGLPGELSPVEDRGIIIVTGTAPEGATPGYVSRYARQVESILDAVPEQVSTLMVTGFPDESRFMSFNLMQPWGERARKTQEIAPELGANLSGVPGVQALPVLPPSLGQGNRSSPIELVVQTTGDYERLGQVMQTLLARAEDNPGLVNVTSDLKLNKPQLSVVVDRDKAALLGVGVAELGRALESYLGGRAVTTFKLDGKQYDVIVQIEDAQRSEPEQLAGIFVRARSGDMIPLSNLVRVSETVSPSSLGHFNKLRSATLSANLTPGYSQGEAVRYLEQAVRDLADPQVSSDWSGPTREFLLASGSLALVFVLALLFIYLLLAAQFESFRHPLVILFTVPLAMLGAVLALRFTGGSINVYSQVGLITLVGLITKHGILIVEFANQLRERGEEAAQAVIEASVQRLRPILMTAATMVLGALPLALATGAGAEARQPIGWVIVGGMSIGTVFTLFVVPAVYLLISARGPGAVRHPVKEVVS
ncbi:efflux RND transporter permease subunit [Amnimonas aquatica]|uniref:Multidrug transporter AcrB n=1 Tax=Amnimonas aquatica TaxID=2094561 RepID=A0A2P6ASW7_9GAMM|nr:efflux RND transporter permease subunit [Amnimonas aquatica]PQA44404.1 multidrug transporter AcrB [Amnimonas aquatica]